MNHLSIRFLSNGLIAFGVLILNSNLGYFSFDLLSFFAEKVFRIVLKKILFFIFEILLDQNDSFQLSSIFKKMKGPESRNKICLNFRLTGYIQTRV